MKFYAETKQVALVRILLAILRDVRTDIQLTYQETGMSFNAVDADDGVLFHVHLPVETFESYECDERGTLCVNVKTLHTILEPFPPEGTIAFWNSEKHPPGLGIIVTNEAKRIWMNYRIHGREEQENRILFPGIDDMITAATLRSADFERIVREMNKWASLIHIRATPERMEFTCSGKDVNVQSVVPQTDEALVYLRPCESPVEGSYSLKHLTMFCKASQLSDTVDIFFHPEWPLMMHYKVDHLGDVRFGLGYYASSTS